MTICKHFQKSKHLSGQRSVDDVKLVKKCSRGGGGGEEEGGDALVESTYRDTWNLGEKGKGRTHNRFPTRHAHRQRRKRRRKNVYLTSVGSAALPESEASNYTYTKVQQKTTEGTREKTEGRGETRERMKKKGERTGTGIWGREVGKGGGGLSCWPRAYDCDSCHVSGCGNQSAPTAYRSCTQPLLRTGPALSAWPHWAQEKHVPGCEGSATQL